MLNKYILSDIQDGLNSIKIGFYNILFPICKGEIKEYTLELPINFLIVSYVLQILSQEFPDIVIDLQYANREECEYNIKSSEFDVKLRIQKINNTLRFKRI